MKKLISLLSAVAAALALSMTAFAAESEAAPVGVKAETVVLAVALAALLFAVISLVSANARLKKWLGETEPELARLKELEKEHEKTLETLQQAEAELAELRLQVKAQSESLRQTEHANEAYREQLLKRRTLKEKADDLIAAKKDDIQSAIARIVNNIMQQEK